MELLLADWEPMLRAVDVDSKLDEFMIVWDTVMNRHCPVVRTRSARLSCPWLRENPELRALMAERDAAREAWLQHGTETDHVSLLAEAEAVCRPVACS